MSDLQHCPGCKRKLPPEAYQPSNRGRNGQYCRDCLRARRQARPPRRRGVLSRAEWLAKAAASTEYSTVHRRIRRVLGSATQHRCAHCEKQAAHWAYDHKDPDAVTGRAGRDVPAAKYSLKPEHYFPLCRSCHSVLDLAHAKATASEGTS